MAIVYEPIESGSYQVTVPVMFKVGDDVFHVNNDNLIEVTKVVGIALRIAADDKPKPLTVSYQCQAIVDRSQHRNYDGDRLFTYMADAVAYVRTQLANV